jgi:hypothetical protein
MIFADAHVHIYDCFDLEKFLSAAYANFQSAATRLYQSNGFTSILLLTETEKDFWFERLRDYANRNSKNRALKKWRFQHTGERVSLTASFSNSKNLIIIAGRQIETAEGLEVLALFTTNNFKSGIPIIDLVREVKKYDGIPVIPWGFGKWLGKRGKILDNFMEKYKDSKIFLGDNGGRPSVLPFPHHFKVAKRNGISILPGSDSLPFTTEYHRAGSFGFILEEEISTIYPAESLKQILMGSKLRIQSYGDFENPFRFFRNQLKMQIKKQYLKYNT